VPDDPAVPILVLGDERQVGHEAVRRSDPLDEVGLDR
jgi:hypothetical protein